MRIATLHIHKEGRRRARTFTVKRWPITIGRSSECDLTLHHTSVSREHCIIEEHASALRIRDFDSRHGIKVNHAVVREAVLGDGDLIRVGPYQMLLTLSSAEEDEGSSDLTADSMDETDALRAQLSALQAKWRASEKTLGKMRVESAESRKAQTQSIEALQRAQRESVNRITKLGSERDRLEVECRSIRDELTAAQAEIERLREHDTRQQRDLETKDEQLRVASNLTSTNAATLKELDDARQRLEQMESLLSEHDRLIHLREELSTRVSELETHLADVTHVRDAAQKELAAAVEEIEDLSQRLQDREGQVQLDAAELQRLQDIAVKAEQGLAEGTAVRNERDELIRRAEAAEAEVESLRRDQETALSMVEDSERTLSEHVRQIAERDEWLATMNDRVDAIDAQLLNRDRRVDELVRAKQDLELRSEQAETAVSDKDAALAEMGREVQTLREQLEERAGSAAVEADRIKELEAELEALRSALRAKEDEESALDSALGNAQEQLLNRDEVIHTLRQEGLENDVLLRAASDEREHLAYEIDEIRRVLDDREAAASASAQSALEARAEVAALQAQLAELDNQFKAVSNERDHLRSLQEEQSDLISKRNDLANRLAETEEQLAAAHAEIETVRGDVESIQPLRDELETTRKRADELSGRLAASHEAISVTNRELAVAVNNRDAFKNRAEELADAREELLKRLKIALSQVEAHKREVASLRARLTRTEEVLRDYVADTESAKGQEASLVEMTPEELESARAEGATVLEIEIPGRS